MIFIFIRTASRFQFSSLSSGKCEEKKRDARAKGEEEDEEDEETEEMK